MDIGRKRLVIVVVHLELWKTMFIETEDFCICKEMLGKTCRKTIIEGAN
jgi:hypothetical protein